MKHGRKLFRTQCLGRQNDLPQSCRANALAQGGFDRVDQRIWNDLLKRLGFCLIDKRPIRARNNKIDFYLAEITQDALQNFSASARLLKCPPGCARSIVTNPSRARTIAPAPSLKIIPRFCLLKGSIGGAIRNKRHRR